MAINASNSEVIFKRIQNAVKSVRDVAEEIERLESLNDTEDIATNLQELASGTPSKAEAVAAFLGLRSFKRWWDNQDELHEGAAEGDNDRVARFNPFLIDDI